VQNIKLICCWLSSDGKNQELQFPEEFKYTKLDVKATSEILKHVKIPLLNEQMIKIDEKLQEESIQLLQDIYEWIGVISIRATSCLFTGKEVTNPIICSFTTPLETYSNAHCVSVKWQGIIRPSSISVWLETIRTMVKEKQIPWAAINVWGFADSPISWSNHEHRFTLSGENDYTFIVLPEDNYWHFVSVSSNDTFC